MFVQEKDVTSLTEGQSGVSQIFDPEHLRQEIEKELFPAIRHKYFVMSRVEGFEGEQLRRQFRNDLRDFVNR